MDRTGARSLGAIALGGAVGATARFTIDLALPVTTGAFPWATWLINVSGALVIGFLLGRVELIGRPAGDLRLFLTTGLLGGFTTVSTFAGETVDLLDAGYPTTAATYVVATLVVGLAAVRVGATLGTRRWPVGGGQRR